MASNLNKKTADEGHNRSPEFKAEQVVKLAEALKAPTKRRYDANQELITLRRDFRTKTGMTNEDFAFGLRLANIDNEDEQTEKMLNMKIAFNALCPNKVLDFISVMDEEKAEIIEPEKALTDEEDFEAQEGEDPNQITVEQAEAAYGDGGDDNKPSTFADDELDEGFEDDGA